MVLNDARRCALDPIEVARQAVEAATEKQASDILLLDLRGLAYFTDYFVVCSADSPRQIDSIANDLERGLRGSGVRLHHREGVDTSGWVLMDFGDVIVHIFSPDQRAYYDLESLWARAPQVVRVQ
jgi:ribosome-associated protein